MSFLLRHKSREILLKLIPNLILFRVATQLLLLASRRCQKQKPELQTNEPQPHCSSRTGLCAQPFQLNHSSACPSQHSLQHQRLWMSPAPQVLILVQSTGLAQPAGLRVPSLPPSLLSPHPLLSSGLGLTSSTQWKIHTANTLSHVKYEQRQKVSLIQFTFNYEQLRQSHLHSSEEPLHQHPGWLSGKLILINFWGYSCWRSLRYSLAAPYQSGSGHVYGSMVL